jgi:hypothetical protein
VLVRVRAEHVTMEEGRAQPVNGVERDATVAKEGCRDGKEASGGSGGGEGGGGEGGGGGQDEDEDEKEGEEEDTGG